MLIVGIDDQGVKYLCDIYVCVSNEYLINVERGLGVNQQQVNSVNSKLLST